MDGEQRIFLCRMNVSRNARRQMRFGDQKVNKFFFIRYSKTNYREKKEFQLKTNKIYIRKSGS